jgi:hypothetical protein
MRETVPGTEPQFLSQAAETIGTILTTITQLAPSSEGHMKAERELHIFLLPRIPQKIVCCEDQEDKYKVYRCNDFLNKHENYILSFLS